MPNRVCRREIAKADNPAYREDLSQPVSKADIPRLPINSTTKRFDRSAFVYDADRRSENDKPNGCKMRQWRSDQKTSVDYAVGKKRQKY